VKRAEEAESRERAEKAAKAAQAAAAREQTQRAAREFAVAEAAAKKELAEKAARERAAAQEVVSGRYVCDKADCPNGYHKTPDYHSNSLSTPPATPSKVKETESSGRYKCEKADCPNGYHKTPDYHKDSAVSAPTPPPSSAKAPSGSLLVDLFGGIAGALFGDDTKGRYTCDDEDCPRSYHKTPNYHDTHPVGDALPGPSAIKTIMSDAALDRLIRPGAIVLFKSSSCQHCPKAVQLLEKLAERFPQVRAGTKFSTFTEASFVFDVACRTLQQYPHN
jgi:hypothetical protein